VDSVILSVENVFIWNGMKAVCHANLAVKISNFIFKIFRNLRNKFLAALRIVDVLIYLYTIVCVAMYLKTATTKPLVYIVVVAFGKLTSPDPPSSCQASQPMSLWPQGFWTLAEAGSSSSTLEGNRTDLLAWTCARDHLALWWLQINQSTLAETRTRNSRFRVQRANH
jgi:hypothetical protein